MRLTTVLRQYAGTRENLVYKMKNRRRDLGFINEPKLSKRDAIFAAQAGITVEDPNELWKPTARYPAWVPPVRLGEELAEEECADLREGPAYIYNTDTKLAEGLKQALILTKSQPFSGMPARVAERVGRVRIPHQDELAQRVIMQANVWDCHTEPIKHPRMPNTPRIWKFKAERGIPDTRIVWTMLNGFTRLFHGLTSQYPDMRLRALTREHNVSSYYYFEEKPVQIRATHPLMLSSRRALRPFADDATTGESTNHQLPDMFPVSPLIDLGTSQTWKMENESGWSEGHGMEPHTAFQVLAYSPTEEDAVGSRNARALMACFGTCLARAKQLYGADVKGPLPSPICSQHVGMDAVGTAQLTFFQLNTLDVDHGDGVKNLVWFENEQELYRKMIPVRSMLRNTTYQDYNPEVLDKLLAMYLLDVDIERPMTGDVKLTVNIPEGFRPVAAIKTDGKREEEEEEGEGGKEVLKS